MTREIGEDEVKAIRWVEWILAPILVVGILTLARCTASAQDELLGLQKDVTNITEVNGQTKAAIQEIRATNAETGKAIVEIQTNQKHFIQEIEAIRDSQNTTLRSQQETNRLLREILRDAD